MSYLLLIANPNPQSFTHSMANIFLGELKKNEYTVLDLYQNCNELAFPKWTKEEDVIREKYQKLLSEHENIVIFHPIWWGAAPAILKNFWDYCFTEGFAYKYEEVDDFIPLLGEKKISLFITTNGSVKEYKSFGSPFKQVWEQVIDVCGFKLVHYSHFGGMRTSTEEERKRYLNEVRDTAKNQGK